MKYFIRGREVSEDEFDIEFDKELEKYKPLSEYWPAKEDVKDKLKEQRYFDFPKGRYFVACEEEILEISYIVEEAEFDTLDCDAIPIAVALWNEGYRKVEK